MEDDGSWALAFSLATVVLLWSWKLHSHPPPHPFIDRSPTQMYEKEKKRTIASNDIPSPEPSTSPVGMVLIDGAGQLLLQARTVAAQGVLVDAVDG